MIFYRINNGEITEPKIISYPDGTLKIDMDAPELTNGCTVTFTWKFDREEEFLPLSYMVRNLRDRFPRSDIELYLPYLPNARMDRVHSDTEVFTLKYFCAMLNSLNFTKVTVLDVHSNVGAALIDRCTNIPPKAYIKKALEMSGFDPENDIVFFPDEGSCKRYTSLFEGCRRIAFGIKKRDWATGKIMGLDVNGDSPEGRNVFIVDDICAYGGTVFHSAKKLKELGCGDISVFFTHCEDSIAKGELFKGDLIRHIYTTNSLCNLPENEKFTIIDCLKGEN